MAWRIGVDIGGTFTDFALQNEETGELVIGKRLTTPRDPSIAALEGVIAGESRNTLDTTLASLTDGNHAIAFHRTGLALRAAAQGEASVIGCGDIPTQ